LTGDGIKEEGATEEGAIVEGGGVVSYVLLSFS